MAASVNKAFKTLDWLQPEDTKFYDAITVVLGRRTQLSSVESELQTHQNEEFDAVSSIQARLKEAVARSKADYLKAIELVSGLKSLVFEIREVLKKLEHESAWEEALFVDWKREWNQCLESHLAINKEEKYLAEQMEEKQKTIEKSRRVVMRWRLVFKA
ncbi:hypothetical protein ACJW31_05G078100 [Castanea mollissima]